MPGETYRSDARETPAIIAERGPAPNTGVAPYIQPSRDVPMA
jgi:hypothetical protein